MKCNHCGKEINDSAKFCRFCGKPVQQAAATKAADEAICKNCGKAISASAKFCRFCGSAVEKANEPAASEERNVEEISNYVTWRILPGQLAVKIDEKEIAAYKTVKGVYVAPGTKALFFVNGRYAASLDSGTYAFKAFAGEAAVSEERKPAEKKNAVLEFFRNISNHIANGVSALFGRNRSTMRDEHHDKVLYTVVLIRGVEFPLVYELKQVATGKLRSDVGLHLLCKITNLNSFFEAHLVDRKMVTLESFAQALLPMVQATVNQQLLNIDPQNVDNNPDLSAAVCVALQERIHNVYSYLTVSQLISLTARHEALEQIRQLKEELYIAELELEQLQLRNDYLNRLQSVEHSNELQMAREEVDFQALMDKIDEDRLLNEDKKAQFVEMLAAQAALRRATTVIDQEVALNKLRQTALLSDEEVALLEKSIQHRSDMADEANAHDLAMATIRNRIEHDKEALRWEIEIGNKVVENELNQQRMVAQFADERREADLNFEQRRMENKMDLLRQAQAIRMEREQAAHEREMEAQRLKAETDLEHHKLNATMTFEQIMASNPNITPEAAAALAKKFEADALAAQNDKTAELVKQHEEDLKQILLQQMNLTKEMMAAQARSNDMAVASKQAELDRVHADSERNQDRFLSGMQTTISAVAGAPKQPVTVEVVFCPGCGKKHTNKDMVCDECGTSL